MFVSQMTLEMHGRYRLVAIRLALTLPVRLPGAPCAPDTEPYGTGRPPAVPALAARGAPLPFVLRPCLVALTAA